MTISGNHSARIAHSIVEQYPLNDGTGIEFVNGKGPFVYDNHGRTFVDCVLGHGPVVIGHSNTQFNDHICELMKNGLIMPGYTTWHEQYLELLLASAPAEWRGLFFKTGSEGISAAIRIAAQVTGRHGLIRCGYIGWHDAQIGNSIRWHESLTSPMRNTTRVTTGVRGIGSNEPVYNWNDLKLETLEFLLSSNKETISAVIIDVYQAHYVEINIIKQAYTLCKKYGVIFVLDETKTGGRIGQFGLSGREGLCADLFVLGKSLGNGAPLSLVIGDDTLLQNAAKARIRSTFAKELYSVYSAMACYNIMNSEGGYDRLGIIGNNIVDTINAASVEAGTVDKVRAESVFNGAIIKLVYYGDMLLNKEQQSKLTSSFRNHGMLLLDDHPSFVCLAHAEIDLTWLQKMLCDSFESWLQQL